MFNIRYSISLKGVSTNNLKNIDVEIPHNKITVITGVSGSGKSSLAFDTVFAEGQNRFLESFSPYVRARIGVRQQADFDEILGLTPTFAVDQSIPGSNPRSTVGTMTGIYDHYRLLFSRFAVPVASNGMSRASVGTHHLSSSLFSFNHRNGACSACDGLGVRVVCDPERIITDPEKPLVAGAMDGTKTGKFYGDPFGQYMATLMVAGNQHGFDFARPWSVLSTKAREFAMNGTGDASYEVIWRFRRDNRTGEHRFTGPWKGLVNLVNEEYARKHADHRGDSMLGLMHSVLCPVCHGARLQNDALSYFYQGINIATLAAMSVRQSIDFFTTCEHSPGSDNLAHEAAIPIIRETIRKLEFLSMLGLSYLAIDRLTSTLSGGEAHRLRLAGQLGSGLTGITYVLDEPTIGLHPRDTGKLMQIIRSLQEAGNTVIIVEHDRDVILSADHVIDVGPGAGKLGGQVLATGTPGEIMQNKASVTGPFLAADFMVQRAPGLPPLKTGAGITVRNAFANNLQGFDLPVPAGCITAITGVSGSGKSTLLFDVIHA